MIRRGTQKTKTLCRVTAAVIALVFALGLGAPAAPAFGAEGYDKVASEGETAKSVDIGSYGMLPVYGRDVKDGRYEVITESSSTFFHVEKTVLTVKDGKMTAQMTLSSASYKFIYPGTAEEAAAAPLEDYIEPKNREGRSTFTMKVEALDTPVDCAAYSKRKKKWYDRKILFSAGSLPEDALKITLPDYERIREALEFYDEAKGTNTLKQAEIDQQAKGSEDVDEGTISVEPAKVNVEDGEYSIQVHMTGGSGRASVTSPTWLTVKDGKAYARLLWSSTYYDYMIVGGKKYLNETTDGGNSTFTIPVPVMDESFTVTADTTAMGHPVEIEYRLTFYEDTIGDKNQIPQEAAINVLILALAIILVGGLLNFLVKRRRKQ